MAVVLRGVGVGALVVVVAPLAGVGVVVVVVVVVGPVLLRVGVAVVGVPVHHPLTGRHVSACPHCVGVDIVSPGWFNHCLTMSLSLCISRYCSVYL